MATKGWQPRSPWLPLLFALALAVGCRDGGTPAGASATLTKVTKPTGDIPDRGAGRRSVLALAGALPEATAGRGHT